MTDLVKTPARIEPCLIEESSEELADLIAELVAVAERLGARLHPRTAASLAELVRVMNCYYSNLIEGRDTHPRDIDRALHKDYSAEPQKRALQLEAVAHIEVQRAIDRGDDLTDSPTSSAYAVWLHREFCQRLPDELLWVEDPEQSKDKACSWLFARW